MIASEELVRNAVIKAVNATGGDEDALTKLICHMAELLGYVSALRFDGSPEGIKMMLDVSREVSDKAAETVSPTLRLLAQPALGRC